jgi:hypothetical protein
MDCRGLPINRKSDRLVERREADSTGEQRHDNSGLDSTPNRESFGKTPDGSPVGNTPDEKKTHSAPVLVRSGHRYDGTARIHEEGRPTSVELPRHTPSENS